MYSAKQAKRDSIAGQKKKNRQIKKKEEDKERHLKNAKSFAKENLKLTLDGVYKHIREASSSGLKKTTYNKLGAIFDNDFNTTFTAELVRLVTKELVNQGFKATYKHEVVSGVKFYDEATPETWIYYSIKIDWI